MYIVKRQGNEQTVIQVNSNVPVKDLIYKYPKNDLGCVFTHYNPETGKNEPTPNKLKEGGN